MSCFHAALQIIPHVELCIFCYCLLMVPRNSAWLRFVDAEYNDLSSKSLEAEQQSKLAQMKISAARSHLSKLQKDLDGKIGYDHCMLAYFISTKLMMLSLT